jgi:magnesium-transporting ATPase (P-type)
MPTERALIRLADQWEYKLSTFRPSPNILRVIKVGNRMISVVDDPEAKKVVVYAKGASEVLLEKCTNILDKDGTFRPLLKDEIESIKNTVIDVYASNNH